MTANSKLNQFVRLDTYVERFRMEAGETEAAAIQRIIQTHADSGWEIVDICDDELRARSLIFHRLPDPRAKRQYMVEAVPTQGYETMVDAVLEFLEERLKEDWLPVCMIDRTLKGPIAILRKSDYSCNGRSVRAHVVSLDVFKQTAKTVGCMLMDKQQANNLGLACVMYGGLHPLLIMISKDMIEPLDDYLVEHAHGGFFSNSTTTLSDVIQSRAEEGWQVCGTFEDIFLWPCVIFRRPTNSMPAARVIPKTQPIFRQARTA